MLERNHPYESIPSDSPTWRSAFPKTDHDLIKFHLLSPGVELLLSQQVKTFIRVNKGVRRYLRPADLLVVSTPAELPRPETLVIYKQTDETVFSVECPLEYGNIPTADSEKNWIDLLIWCIEYLENGTCFEHSLRVYRVVPPGEEPIQRFLTLLRSRALIYGKIRGSAVE